MKKSGVQSFRRLAVNKRNRQKNIHIEANEYTIKRKSANIEANKSAVKAEANTNTEVNLYIQ